MKGDIVTLWGVRGYDPRRLVLESIQAEEKASTYEVVDKSRTLQANKYKTRIPKAEAFLTPQAAIEGYRVEHQEEINTLERKIERLKAESLAALALLEGLQHE